MPASLPPHPSGATYCPPPAITAVTDRNGDPMDVSGADCHQAVDKDVADVMAWTLQQDLEDPKATGKGKTIEGHPAGGKTGTSGSQFHTWYVGFTRQMSTAVWFGHPQAHARPGGFAVHADMPPKRSVCGSPVSLPTGQATLTRVHADLPSEPFPPAPASTKTAAGESAEKGVVPDVSGMVLSEAEATIEAAGYKHEVKREKNDDVGQWYVIGTDPTPGTDLPEGETVVIRQSTGGE